MRIFLSFSAWPTFPTFRFLIIYGLYSHNYGQIWVLVKFLGYESGSKSPEYELVARKSAAAIRVSKSTYLTTTAAALLITAGSAALKALLALARRLTLLHTHRETLSVLKGREYRLKLMRKWTQYLVGNNCRSFWHWRLWHRQQRISTRNGSFEEIALIGVGAHTC